VIELSSSSKRYAPVIEAKAGCPGAVTEERDQRATPQVSPMKALTLRLRARLRHEWRRVRHVRRLDLYFARALGRPLSDRLYLAIGHLLYFGNWPDFDQPRTFNEHIMAYMLRCRDPILRIAADKLRTRQYIAERVGPDYLVPLLGTWDTADEVPLESLPRPCVLKPTAASGMVLFLREGAPLDAGEIRATLRDWLRCDYSRYHREWSYSGLKQRLMAEHMLIAPDGGLPPDYKVYVIGNKVRFIQVDRGRFAHHTRNLYLPDWQPAPARLTLENHPPDPRPRRLDELIHVAERLAEPFEFLRVDCYFAGDKLYLGELTNSPGAGFEKLIPSSYAYELGRHWQPRKKGG
jgi:hypothetical protein